MLYSRILLCSLLVFAGVSVYGQSPQKNDTSTFLNQSWKIQALYTHNFSADEQEELDDFIKTTFMQFNTDGSFITRSDTVIMKGKWHLDGQTLMVQMEEGDSFRMKILFLSRNALKFESRPPDSEKIFSSGMLVPLKGIIASVSAN